MPEGPEVRKYADALNAALSGRRITAFEARTRDARAWLKDNLDLVLDKRIERVLSHGKHLVGYVEGGFFFHSHLMMWGRWQTLSVARPQKHKRRAEALVLPERDRRERARIVTDRAAAILLSAPIFDIGQGDPYKIIDNLATLGPDVLPYNKKFDRTEFQRRLLSTEHLDLEIGAALLNQQIVAGLGNYLRAEILFDCKLSPWRRVSELSKSNLDCLMRSVPKVSRLAYEKGATAGEVDRKRMAGDRALVYQAGREYGTRHLVFRRTNLPCLRCGESIRQLRQKTYNSETAEGQEERTRITYFCAKCQRVKLDSLNNGDQPRARRVSDR